MDMRSKILYTPWHTRCITHGLEYRPIVIYIGKIILGFEGSHVIFTP